MKPTKQRLAMEARIYRLRVIDGLSYPVIAERVGCDRNTARRIVEKLIDRIREDGAIWRLNFHTYGQSIDGIAETYGVHREIVEMAIADGNQ